MWSVVNFDKTNEIQHVPNVWIISNKCWFPYLKSDKKEIFFSPSQINKMIKKCTDPNNNDGMFHQAKVIAGPFCESIFNLFSFCILL